MLLLNSRMKQVTGRSKSNGHMKVLLFQRLEAQIFRFAVSKINDRDNCSFVEAIAMLHRESGYQICTQNLARHHQVYIR
jgi:hypothetical protein